ncbi:hypothetical protein KFE25_007193 [Diacronema lutheri]|uniref:Calcineurin-like phosphoesterase domain-containing protein n=2 Tax=Diacronema lutheri TaxID=2081491 RepID=A0A8J6CEH9_DIALT|nr:hypothetical protein KFE25_007193 [Diacronema lutheri]
MRQLAIACANVAVYTLAALATKALALSELSHVARWLFAVPLAAWPPTVVGIASASDAWRGDPVRAPMGERGALNEVTLWQLTDVHLQRSYVRGASILADCTDPTPADGAATATRGAGATRAGGEARRLAGADARPLTSELAGQYGHRRCDSPRVLLESALELVRTEQPRRGARALLLLGGDSASILPGAALAPPGGSSSRGWPELFAIAAAVRAANLSASGVEAVVPCLGNADEPRKTSLDSALDAELAGGSLRNAGSSDGLARLYAAAAEAWAPLLALSGGRAQVAALLSLRAHGYYALSVCDRPRGPRAGDAAALGAWREHAGGAGDQTADARAKRACVGCAKELGCFELLVLNTITLRARSSTPRPAEAAGDVDGARSSEQRDAEAESQLSWLEKRLRLAQRRGRTALIVGHTPPLIDWAASRARDGPVRPWWDAAALSRYVRILRTHGECVGAQLFGGLHHDEFGLLPPARGGRPHLVLSAPSLSPNGGGFQPAVRALSFELGREGARSLFGTTPRRANSRAALGGGGRLVLSDVCQYVLRLQPSNLLGVPLWRLSYCARALYGLSSLDGGEWARLLAAMRSAPNNGALLTYQYVTDVGAPGSEWFFDDPSRLPMLCAIDCTDPSEFRRCRDGAGRYAPRAWAAATGGAHE